MTGARLAFAAAILLQAAFSAQAADARSWLERAKTDEALGRTADAVRELEAGLRGRPEYALFMELGEDYVNLGRLDSARKAFEAAKRLDRRQADAYIREGYMDLSAGHAERAERDFEDLIAVDSANPAGYHHLGSTLSFEGRPAEAEHYFREALRRLDRHPSADEKDRLHAIAWLGDVLMDQGRAAQAAAMYRHGLALSASDPDFQGKFLMSLGWIYDSRGLRSQAEDSFEKAAKACADPAACPAYGIQTLLALADFQAAHGDPKRAADNADVAWRRLSKLPAEKLVISQEWPMFNELGRLFLKLGDAEKAAEVFRERSARLKPWKPRPNR